MSTRYKPLFNLRESLPSSSRTERNRKYHLTQLLHRPLDRVNVLGDEDNGYGHTGCVNALSWANNGDVLLSGGDDTTVRIWRMDCADTEQEYPFVCRSVINTGHRANIFNAQLLPNSSTLVTVAGDKQIRVSDINVALSATSTEIETQYNTRQCATHVLRCHSKRVKRIVTEESSALFLTASEDGTIRQHDLRTPHNCRENSCSTPLVKLEHAISTFSLSVLTPYQFVVAGESPYGYLFDRRNIGRRLTEEWGIRPSPSSDEVTTCVRRFGRPPQKEKKKRFPRDHVTGSKMSNSNGHEILLTYSGDAAYLFSTLDDPCETRPSTTFSCTSSPRSPGTESHNGADHEYNETFGIESTAEPALDDQSESDNENEIEAEEAAEMEANYRPGVPVIMPRRRYVGARNVETVKDVNFLGPDDGLVVSGSDDGNFFVWNKSSGELNGIYEGDSSVVNVIEGHPSLPLVAVSGIDTTVKLFVPAKGPSVFSRLSNAEEIMKVNARPAQIFDLRVLLTEAMLRTESTAECVHQ